MYENNENQEQERKNAPEQAGAEPVESSTDRHRPDSNAGDQRRTSDRSSAPGYGESSGYYQQNGGYSNRYDAYGDRYQGQQNSPPPYQPNQPYSPYQQPYPPAGGWQPYNRPEPPRYEWNFQDYESLDGAGGPEKRKRRNKGLFVFLVCLVVVFSVSLIALSTYGVFMDAGTGEPEASGVRGDAPDAGSQTELPDSAAQSPQGVGENEEVPEITIYNRPYEDDPVALDGKLTIPQVAEAVLPSVVGVIKYENSQLLQASGVGSGIVMTEDGYIITNAHVVSGGTDFKVEAHDGTTYDATLVGLDAPTDLAVIKVDATGLIPARFGDSNQIQVGETVVAIGNPASLQLKGSVTRGIVSAVNRELDISSYSMTYIQTDAAINPGNSGGALCNEFGQVIGINSSKIVAEGFEGIGFAIPITDAQPVLQDILNHGRVTGRVKLGITGYEVDSVDARNYGLPMGIQIMSIEPGSSMAATSAQRGDIITAIDGESTVTMLDLRGVLNEHQVGDTVTLTLYRPTTTGRGSTFTVDVRLMEDDT